MLAEARASALGLGDEAAWIEKIVVATEPKVDPKTLAEREDAIGELQRMLAEAGSDVDLLEQIESDIGELVRRLGYTWHFLIVAIHTEGEPPGTHFTWTTLRGRPTLPS